MKGMLAVLVALAMLILPSPAQPASTPASYDEGNMTCATWTKVRSLRSDPNEITSPESWVWGYLTAYNDMTQGDIVGGQYRMNAAIAWMDNYCSANPLDNVHTATKALVARLQRGN